MAKLQLITDPEGRASLVNPDTGGQVFVDRAEVGQALQEGMRPETDDEARGRLKRERLGTSARALGYGALSGAIPGGLAIGSELGLVDPEAVQIASEAHPGLFTGAELAVGLGTALATKSPQGLIDSAGEAVAGRVAGALGGSQLARVAGRAAGAAATGGVYGAAAGADLAIREGRDPEEGALEGFVPGGTFGVATTLGLTAARRGAELVGRGTGKILGSGSLERLSKERASLEAKAQQIDSQLAQHEASVQRARASVAVTEAELSPHRARMEQLQAELPTLQALRDLEQQSALAEAELVSQYERPIEALRRQSAAIKSRQANRAADAAAAEAAAGEFRDRELRRLSDVRGEIGKIRESQALEDTRLAELSRLKQKELVISERDKALSAGESARAEALSSALETNAAAEQAARKLVDVRAEIARLSSDSEALKSLKGKISALEDRIDAGGELTQAEQAEYVRLRGDEKKMARSERDARHAQVGQLWQEEKRLRGVVQSGGVDVSAIEREAADAASVKQMLSDIRAEIERIGSAASPNHGPRLAELKQQEKALSRMEKSAPESMSQSVRRSLRSKAEMDEAGRLAAIDDEVMALTDQMDQKRTAIDQMFGSVRGQYEGLGIDVGQAGSRLQQHAAELRTITPQVARLEREVARGQRFADQSAARAERLSAKRAAGMELMAQIENDMTIETAGGLARTAYLVQRRIERHSSVASGIGFGAGAFAGGVPAALVGVVGPRIISGLAKRVSQMALRAQQDGGVLLSRSSLAGRAAMRVQKSLRTTRVAASFGAKLMSADEFAAVRDSLQNFSPERIQAAAEQASYQADPASVYDAADAAIRAGSYLRQEMPQPPPGEQFRLGSSWQPSTDELRIFSRKMEAVMDPEHAVQQMADGHVRAESVRALQAVYPDQLEAIRAEFIPVLQASRSGRVNHDDAVFLAVLFDDPALLPREYGPQMMSARRDGAESQQQKLNASQADLVRFSNRAATQTQRALQGE